MYALNEMQCTWIQYRLLARQECWGDVVELFESKTSTHGTWPCMFITLLRDYDAPIYVRYDVVLLFHSYQSLIAGTHINCEDDY